MSAVSRFSEHYKDVEDATIFNLPNYKNKDDKFDDARYNEFMTFYNTINNQLDTEIQRKQGNIIDSFPVSAEYSTVLEEVKKNYYDMYLKPIDDDKKYRLPTITDQTNSKIIRKYPHFLKDMFNKNNLIYQKYEKEYGFPLDSNGIPIRIEDQTDEQIFELLGKRIEGLQRCQTYRTDKLEPTEENYYKTEFERESLLYTELKADSSLSISEKVENMCKYIFYNLDALTKYDNSKIKENIDSIMNTIKIFMEKDNGIEELYARTYLPESCFKIVDGKYKLDYAKLRDFILSGDRNYRQFVFGFYISEKLNFIREFLKPILFEAGGMAYKKNYQDSCDLLVNWSLFLNMLYCRCGISNNSVLCPIRFVLPLDLEITKQSTSIDKTSDGTINTIQFEMREKQPLLDLFDGDVSQNARFIGIISIKYYHETTSEIRIWYFFVFENNDEGNWQRQNAISGVRDKILLCNYRLRQINMGALFEKHNITHYELLHYISLSKQRTIPIYFYKLLGVPDNNTIFISKNSNLEEHSLVKDLQLVKINITTEYKSVPGEVHTIPKTIIKMRYITNLQSGGDGNKIINSNIKTTFEESKLYQSDYALGKEYNTFLDLYETVEKVAYYNDDINVNYVSTKRHYLFDYLMHTYPYINVEKRNALFSRKYAYDNKYESKLFNIVKYTPISPLFYSLNEITIKYDIFGLINEKSNIMSIGNSYGFLELVAYKNYKINNLFKIILENEYKPELKVYWDTILKNQNNISKIYNFNIINFKDNIYNITNLDANKNNDIIFFDGIKMINMMGKYSNYYNIPIYVSCFIFILEHLSKNGCIIFNIENVAYKHTADLVIIIGQFFDSRHLYHPEIHSQYKRNGSFVIFKNFKGITENDRQYLYDILEGVRKIYPNEANDFNIHNPNLRSTLHLTRTPIPNKPMQNIISFLDYDVNDNIYEPFRQFNTARYSSQCLFFSKMLNILTSPNCDKFLETKLPTPDQITSSILYCKKWDIPYFDKYNTSKMDSYITRNILSEMYGLHEPILYKFKTPYKTHIADKIVLNPRLSSRTSSTDGKSKASSSILSTTRSKTISTRQPLDKKTKKRLSDAESIGAFLKDIMQTSILSYKSRKSSKSITKHATIESRQSRRRSTMKRENMSSHTIGMAKRSGLRSTPLSLLEPLFTSNNQLVQVGRLIDSRRDFTKPTKKPNADYDPQIVLYDTLKWQFRYYKGKGTSRHTHNLDTLVQQRLGDSSISQAWLKMYEIITDCDLVPRTQKGTFRSFHLCEAPGTFINALNNYIRTKTSYTDFDWMAQSLHPRLADIKDTYGLIRRHSTQWDWGADGTGDITQVANIRHYARLARQRFPQGINLMTSDCGLPMGDPKYELVAFASYVAILAILPKGGAMVYKILSPIDLPLIWNLIYITFTNFKEFAFFKPVQNAQSREFYIIAKDYLGTAPPVIDKLLDIVQRWSRLDKQEYKSKWLENLDLFNDKYPEEFVAQVLAISERLAQNYVNSIERIIYYVDNNKSLGDEYTRHIEKYIEENNEDWIRRYRPRKLENKWIL